MPRLFMLTEHSPFMMSFVFLTDGGRAVVIDGGRPADIPELLDIVGARPIAAWILTHPHFDHISGFNRLWASGECNEQIERVYHNFPSSRFVLSCEPQFTEEEPCSALDFEKIQPSIGDKSTVAMPGTSVDVDELHIDFLYSGGERHLAPRPNLAVNESSLAFRVTAPGMRSVLFLGDLGPAGGDEMLRTCGDALRSDIVQMAHHGHSGVTFDVYERIAPLACMWCAAKWLYDEDDIEFEPGLWGTRHTRKWMDRLGVTEHYVSGDGTQEIPLSS